MNQTPCESLEVAPAPQGVRGLRATCACLTLAAGAQVGLTMARLPAWSCPFHAITGLPCPGCGLTRATVAFLRGDFAASMRWHVMGPLVPVAGLIFVALLVLPPRWQARLWDRLILIERRTHLGQVMAAILMGYWILRVTGVCALPSG